MTDTIAPVVSLAAHRADKAAGRARPQLTAAATRDGQHVALFELGDDGKMRAGGFRRYLTRGEAEELRRAIGNAEFNARRLEAQAIGFVRLAWCRTDGRAVTQQCVRFRIVERAVASVRLVRDPEQWQTEPREGWPADGWYRAADGWPTDHDPARRGWRVVAGIEQGASK